jgi:NADH-quinone oxidoreductase subunit F
VATTTEARLLAGDPVTTIDDWIEHDGGRGLDAAREMGAEALVASVEAAGLRGRGGAGFPTATKWRTVLEYRSPELRTPVVINGAEGEPGTFKDRTILRHNPYQVVEGALIAAAAVGADWIIFALKDSFTREIDALERAIGEIATKGWSDGITIDIERGPDAYLYGEETALLEVIDGGHPFPRVAPPWRSGIDIAPTPTLVDNVETVANLPRLVANGPEWFRSLGTDRSPGTIVCTITGAVRTPGVAEVAMGTPLRDVIDTVGGGAREGRTVTAALSGVANAILVGDALDTPLTYEDMVAAGSGLGSCGFMVFDDETDFVAVAHGVARFLAVESCGQCTPCKADGKRIADALDRLRRSEPDEHEIDVLRDRLRTVTDGARCYLAHQHQTVVTSILQAFERQFHAHADAALDPVPPFPVAEMLGIDGTNVVINERQLRKQPDWSYDDVDSGAFPADRIDERAGGAG